MANDLQLFESSQLKVMIEVANSMPRDLDNFVPDVCKEVMRDVEKSREFALSCVYCVPVGKVDGVQKFHSDPSVRVTEIMQKYWKHLRVIVTGSIDPNEISVQGLIFDCQGNNSETLVSSVKCEGWSDRRKELKFKAMQSIMKRDLRLSIMGKGYANEIKQHIFDTLFPDIPNGWKECVAAFSNYKVTENTLLRYFKIGKADEVTREMLFNALGIFNYIRENNEDPANIFGGESKKPNIRPEDIKVEEKKSTKKPKSHQTPGNGPSSPSEETPVVMGSDEFESLVASLALQAGIKLEDGLKEIVGVDHPGDVLPDDQSKVIDFFESKKETPGA